MDGVQGGSSNDTLGQVFGVIEMVFNPLKLVEKIFGGLFGGDSVSTSQAQQGTAGGTTTEMYQPSAQWPGYMQGNDKKKDEEMAKALEIVEANYDLFDNANGKFGKDGKITLAELNQIACDKSLPQEVRDAAKKIHDSPWLMNRLDQGIHGSAPDGAFNLADVKWLRGNIEQTAKLNTAADQAAQSSPTQGPDQKPQVDGRQETTPQQGGQAPEVFQGGADQAGLNPYIAQSQSAMTSVLDDPTIGFEAKSQIFLGDAMQGAEEESLNVFRQYEKALRTQVDPNASQDQKDKAEVDAALLQHRLQKALQHRQEMYQLMTNMTDMSHDMSMAAIRNMKD